MTEKMLSSPNKKCVFTISWKYEIGYFGWIFLCKVFFGMNGKSMDEKGYPHMILKKCLGSAAKNFDRLTIVNTYTFLGGLNSIKQIRIKWQIGLKLWAMKARSPSHKFKWNYHCAWCFLGQGSAVSLAGMGYSKYMSRGMRFPTMWYMRPAKPQTCLRVRAV